MIDFLRRLASMVAPPRMHLTKSGIIGAVRVWRNVVLVLIAGCGDTTPAGDLNPPAGCTDDTQCGAPTPRCDRNAARCVPCLPLNDNCPMGQHCVASNGSFICSTACAVDGDCPRSDAGSPKVCCAGACVDIMVDSSHCGRCGATCLTPANAVAACILGSCGIGACKPG